MRKWNAYFSSALSRRKGITMVHHEQKKPQEWSGTKAFVLWSYLYIHTYLNIKQVPTKGKEEKKG